MDSTSRRRPGPALRLRSGALLAACAALPVAFDPPPSAGQDAPGHAFIGGTFRGNKIVSVTAKGEVEWKLDAPACLDVWKLPNGNILYASRSRGIIEINADKKVVWSFKTDGETYSCQRLPSGRTLVGDNKNGRVIEVDPDGTVAREVKLTTKVTEHTMIRMVRSAGEGRYLVTQRGDNVVREYDADGKVVWEFKIPGPMSAVRLPNKNTLIAGYFGNGGVVEVDPDGKEVWKWDMKDLPDAPKGKKPYGVHRLPNGNTVLCFEGTILELSPEKKVVWTRTDKAFDMLMVAQVTDVPGDATKGEVLR